MRLGSWVGIVPVAALALPALSGCGGPTREAYQFNQALVAANDRIDSAGKDFVGLLRPLRDGKPVAAEELKKASDRVLVVLSEVKEEVKRLKPPDDSRAAQDLLKAEERYIEGQEEMYRAVVPDILKDAADEKTPIAVRWGIVDRYLKQLNT